MSSPTWFGKLYRQAEVHRVVARERTGLLSHEAREELERQFIRPQNAWYPNLISATPMLEMGIDIGYLSSVYLCSIPSAQAKYLQRIGRAGRSFLSKDDLKNKIVAFMDYFNETMAKLFKWTYKEKALTA